jgi:hypothetical protein
MIPPLLVIILCVPQLSLDLLVPLLLLEEPESGLVLFAGPLGEPDLRFTLCSGSLSLEIGDSLELSDRGRDGLGLGLAFHLDDFGETLGIFLL